MVATRHQPATVLAGLARRGSARRTELERALAEALDVIVPAVVTALVRRVDLTALVEQHVDLDRVVAGVDLDTAVQGVDLDAVASRLDVEAVVSRLDLTEIVRRQVDLDALVAGVDIDAVAARLDVEAVIHSIDLAGLANEVIAAVDLPEIIRESTGSVASDTLRGVRMQSISGDQALARAIDRLRRTRPAVPSQSGPAPGGEAESSRPSSGPVDGAGRAT
jgi:hypothetical protein